MEDISSYYVYFLIFTADIINKLSDIQILHTKTEIRYIKSVSKEQNEILECLGLDDNIIEKVVYYNFPGNLGYIYPL